MNPNYREILKQIMDFKTEGIRVLLAGLLIKLIIGIFYAWPILQSYHEILIDYQDQDHKYIHYISYALMILIMNLLLPHSDYFLKKISPQSLICILVCSLGISFMLIAIFDQNWILHILIQLLVIAPSVGILYSVPFLTCWKYFVKQKCTSQKLLEYLNSIFQVFIGLGACFTILIFSSNQENQLELYYDENQYFCGECFNLQVRQSIRAITVWIFILGIAATALIKTPDNDVVDSVVDYDLLAFAHLDLKQQQHSQHSQNDNDQSFDQPPSLIQALSSKPFQTMSMLVVSSSLIPYLIFCQYQRIQSQLGIHYSQTVTTFMISILIYSLARFIFNYFASDWQYHYIIKRLGQFNMLLLLIFIFSLWFNNEIIINLICSIFVISLAVLFSVISISIPKIFGPLASQGVFAIMLAIMGLSAVLSNSVSYFFENTRMMLFYFSIKVFLSQMYVYRIVK